MNDTLHKTVQALLEKGKGILAADESDATCGRRFEKYGIPNIPEMRRKWRELLFSTPEIEKGLSGVILFDETIRQKTSTEVSFSELLKSHGILVGIKVDQKTEPFVDSPKEEVTKGLEGLSARLAEYAKLGAKFAKWRAVIRIDAGLPTRACLQENAKRLAAYTHASQTAELVPILEPEVLLDGTHTLARCEEVLVKTLRSVFDEVKTSGANLSELLLKSSMALPGKESDETASPAQIAEATLRAFTASVPKEVPGIVFLSGGQTPQEATVRLNEIVKTASATGRTPWRLSFSYSRALQDPVLKEWAGKEEKKESAQKIFAERVRETARAARGEYL